MKKTKAVQILTQLAMTATIAALAGCASGNYEKGSKTGAGLTAAADKITAGQVKIDATLNALNDIVNNPQSDLTPRFKKFSSALSDLQATGEHVKARVADMRANGNEYFKAWDEQLAQIQNEDIKTRSAARRAEVAERFERIKRNYAEAEIAFKPFISNLKDIQAALATDLTADGVNAIKGAADQATRDSVPLKQSLDKLATEFRELGVAMGAATAPPQPPPAK